MREFYVYGFKSRTEYDAKSARSYDNVRRRMDSWLGEYMSFRQSDGGKAQFLSVDSRAVAHNPLYQAFKAKAFTDNDILLHFCLLDLIGEEAWKCFRDIVDALFDDYFARMETELLPDESTIRNKLKEYVGLGLLEQKKEGKSYLYRRCKDACNADSWRDAVAFFSEVNPLGVVGSCLLDREEFQTEDDMFRYKHHYMLYALDSQILYQLLDAMSTHCCVEIRARSRKREEAWTYRLLPLRIYISTQTGREYLLGYEYHVTKMSFFCLDNITSVKKGDFDEAWPDYENQYKKLTKRLWGVSLGHRRGIDHVELTLHVDLEEQFIVKRLEREKRNGEVIKIDDVTWRYVVDTHEAMELLPWVRTFIGRIQGFTCSDPQVEKMFWDDLRELERMYLTD